MALEQRICVDRHLINHLTPIIAMQATKTSVLTAIGLVPLACHWAQASAAVDQTFDPFSSLLSRIIVHIRLIICHNIEIPLVCKLHQVRRELHYGSGIFAFLLCLIKGRQLMG